MRLFFDDPWPLELAGWLLDYSWSGFRAAHNAVALETGQEVRFRHDQAEGTARVVWNRVLAGHVESGFLILERRGLDV